MRLTLCMWKMVCASAFINVEISINRGELVTFVRKAVNFRHVIIHVINIGHSHSSNNCHVISWASRKYRYYTLCIAVQAICNFAARLRGIPSFFEFHDTHCTWAVKYGDWVSHANQLQWTSILGSLWTCISSVHPKTFFYQPWSSFLSWPIFCWIFKMSYVHMVSFCTVIGTSRARCQKLTTFPLDVTRLSLLTTYFFDERAWG